ncbi:hypothetical protein G210_3543 [Candida maltosa Xu316]|uniref:M-phase inducer phosphatase n=1 Tax=Candida maltosa (strain Xu316) TaxID=1245528 RepID=M3IIN9_CANMX|nr:hypothetical protein G210_3543 [Candida maltosa Xu316]
MMMNETNHNNINNNNNNNSRVKRDRPNSLYFNQSPSPSSPSPSPSSPSSSTSSTSSPSFHKSFPRIPLKNLANLPLPLPLSSVKSKTKQFTRSMTEMVSKSSSSPFNSLSSTPQIEFNSIDNIDIQTNYDSQEEDQNNLHDHEEDDDDNDDTFDTINLGSPIQKKSSINSMNTSQQHQHPSQIRRFHSMYQTTKEIEHHQNHFHLKDNSYLKLSTIEYSIKDDLLPRISHHQLVKIINGDHIHEFNHFKIIDCRFDYEFNGGHIINALNLSSKDDLENYFNQHKTLGQDKQLIIFHCEFSVFRGPMMAKHLRKWDRMINYDNYPKLNFPDIVILEGGYKNFYESYPHLCDPQDYVAMKDLSHEQSCESNLDKFRKESKLTRAKSYQFTPSTTTNNNTNNINNNGMSFWSQNHHHRSQSYSTITNEKIIKRQRSIPKFKESSPSLKPINRLTRANTISLEQPFMKPPSSPPLLPISPINTNFDNNNSLHDFQPPSTSFHNNNKSSSSSNFSTCSINSINSITSSNIGSDTGSVESLLTEPYTSSSPIENSSDYFEPKPTLIQKSTHSRPHFLRRQGSRNIQQQSSSSSSSQSLQQLQFQFPKSSRQTNSNNSNSSSSTKLFTSGSNIFYTSPVNNHHHGSNHSISSPFFTPNIDSNSSSITTANTNATIIDPINDTPVDFSIPCISKIAHQLHKRTGSLLGTTILELRHHNDNDSDQEEEDEEQEQGLYNFCS